MFELEPELGWDGVDEVMAELRGFRTAGYHEFGFRHHRKVGEREGRLRAGAALGRQAWYMGYRPSYLLLRAVYRSRENFAVAGDGLRLRGGRDQRRAAVPAPGPSPTASARDSACASSCAGAAGPDVSEVAFTHNR